MNKAKEYLEDRCTLVLYETMQPTTNLIDGEVRIGEVITQVY